MYSVLKLSTIFAINCILLQLCSYRYCNKG
uniref:Uncharacterized protein n=1 Tax=Rhizophora mucronata TaxID=61149 RepID=A0A2P2Q6E9_RHIMU